MNIYKVRSVVASRWVSYLLLFILYWISATATISGFLGKWALRDSSPTYGIEQVLDNTAIKPFAYRILLPTVASAADRFAPARVKAYAVDKLGPYRTFTRATSSEKANYAFRYVVIIYLCLGFCLASLYALRKILLELNFSKQAATSVPVAFMLAFPFVQTIGGYFYDYPELFFLSVATLLAIRNQWLLLIFISIPATLNKEAFFFFLPALYPLFRAHASRKTVLSVLGAAIALSGLVNIAVKWAYRGAEGGAAHFQLFNNLHKYLLPSTYGQLEITYGFVGPSGPFMGTLLIIAVIIVRGWQYCPARVRTHFLIASAINIPLFILFCAPGEMRNLSLLFVGFVVLMTSALESPVDSHRAASVRRSSDNRLSTIDA